MAEPNEPRISPLGFDEAARRMAEAVDGQTARYGERTEFFCAILVADLTGA